LVQCETYSIGSIGQTMDSVSLVCDLPSKAQFVRRQLERIFDALILPVNRIRKAGPPGRYSVVSIDLDDPAQISDTREWLEQRPKDAKVVFITRRSSRHDALQAYAIGATDLVHPPFDGRSLLRRLYGDFESLARAPSDFSVEGSPGVAAAFEALQSVFSSRAWAGRSIKPPSTPPAKQSSASSRARAWHPGSRSSESIIARHTSTPCW